MNNIVGMLRDKCCGKLAWVFRELEQGVWLREVVGGGVGKMWKEANRQIDTVALDGTMRKTYEKGE